MAAYTGIVAKTKCGGEFLKHNCLCNYKWLLTKIQVYFKIIFPLIMNYIIFIINTTLMWEHI